MIKRGLLAQGRKRKPLWRQFVLEWHWPRLEGRKECGSIQRLVKKEIKERKNPVVRKKNLKFFEGSRPTPKDVKTFCTQSNDSRSSS